MPPNLYRSQYVNSLAHDDSLVASSNMIRIGPGNGLVPVRRQGILWIYSDVLWIGRFGIYLFRLNQHVKLYFKEM